MISYRDLTFCEDRECAKWGSCDRALTELVRREAQAARLPIAVWLGGFQPECFTAKKEAPRAELSL